MLMYMLKAKNRERILRILHFLERQIYRQVFIVKYKKTRTESGAIMARRGENIYLRKDGRYEGRYIKSRRPDRKPIYGSVYARKYNECKEKLTHARILYMHEGRIVKTCGTGNISDYMEYWLYNIAKPGVKASTFGNYVANTENWIIPLLGGMKMGRADKEDIQRFVNALSEQGLSAGTVRNIYRVLYTAMKKAKEYGYLYNNPCDKIKLPEIEQKEARLLTLQEQKTLETAAKADRNGFAVLLAMYTGLRVGELCALKWSDVDLESSLIRISETRQRIRALSPGAGAKTVLITGSAKSRRSARIIPLPVCMARMFREHREQSDGQYVFSCHGRPLEPRVLQYRFKVLLKKAGLPDINFHSLRHTFATRCMELCFDVKTLSEILGHASAKMTLDKYGHSQIAHKQAAMQSLDRLFVASA